MRVNYYPETDSLYIDLSEKTSVESKEISEGVVLDYDAEGNLVGIDKLKPMHIQPLFEVEARKARNAGKARNFLKPFL